METNEIQNIVAQETAIVRQELAVLKDAIQQLINSVPPEKLGAFNNPTAAGLAVMQAANAAAQRTLLSVNNTDNTSDAKKPVSTATQTALDLKANAATTPSLRTVGTTLTAAGTLTANADTPVDATTAAFDATLPAASTSIGKDVGVLISTSSSNAVTVVGAGGAKVIGNAGGYVLPTGAGAQYNFFMFFTNGTDWFIR